MENIERDANEFFLLGPCITTDEVAEILKTPNTKSIVHVLPREPSPLTELVTEGECLEWWKDSE